MKIGMRRILCRAFVVAFAFFTTSCTFFTAPDTSKTDGRITATVHAPLSPLLTPGIHPLGLGDNSRDGWVFVPDQAANGPVPLVVLMHGAGQSADEWNAFIPMLRQLGVAAIAIDSRKASWDYRYGFGPDVHFIDVALQYTVDRLRVDPEKVALAGFSDGATYSLTLGLTNGDLFRKVIAFSPSGPVFLERRGTPPIFISHGTNDTVLPFADTRDYTVPTLTKKGYTVRFEQFTGGHTVPSDIASTAFAWWLAGA